MNCLKHHIKPSIPKTHDRFLIHCGTNNLNSEGALEKIVNDIIELGNAVKTKKGKSVISRICPCRYHFNKKAYEVNQLLAGKYGENGFNYIPHDNISTGLYFSRDGFHLKRKGIY